VPTGVRNNSVDTGEGRPTGKPLHRQVFANSNVVDTYVQEMLNCGLLSPLSLLGLQLWYCLKEKLVLLSLFELQAS